MLTQLLPLYASVSSCKHLLSAFRVFNNEEYIRHVYQPLMTVGCSAWAAAQQRGSSSRIPAASSRLSLQVNAASEENSHTGIETDTLKSLTHYVTLKSLPHLGLGCVPMTEQLECTNSRYCMPADC